MVKQLTVPHPFRDSAGASPDGPQRGRVQPNVAAAASLRAAVMRLLRDASPYTLSLMAVRSLTIAAKFGLTVFIARYLGLADLGAYGLITSAAVVLPVLFGFGVANNLGRDAVQKGSAAIGVQILQYFLVLLPIYLVLGVAAVTFLPKEERWFCALAPLMLLEHIQTDMFSIMVITGRALAANVINMIRAAGWVLVYIPLALAHPGWRHISTVCLAWLGGCIAATLLTAVFTTEWRWGEAMRALPSRRFTLPHRHGSSALYLNDLANTLFQYVDRYVVGIFLSPVMLGVYVLFWSIVNAISNVITTAIVQPRRGELVQIADQPTPAFNAQVWSLTFLTSRVALALSVVAVAFIYIAAPHIGRPEIYPYLPLMIVLCAALVVRTAYEVVGIAFYAHRRDDITLYSGVAILVVAVVLNLLLDPTLGIWGAGVALLSSYVIGLISRRRIVFRGFKTRREAVPDRGAAR